MSKLGGSSQGQNEVGTETPKRLMPRRLAIIIGLLLLISVVGLSIIYWVIKAEKDSLPYEIAKALIQLAIAATAGAIISVAVFEYQRESQIHDKDIEDKRQKALKAAEGRQRRQEAKQEKTDRQQETEQAKAERQREAEQERTRRQIEYRDELLKSILARAVENYNSVKKARRLLVARAKFTDAPVSFGIPGEVEPHARLSGKLYDLYLDTIIDAQLEFENLEGDVRSSRPIITDQPKLAASLEAMEGYLNQIIGEYKEKRPEFRKSDDSLELSALDKLAAFLESSKTGSFKQFSGPMRKVQEAIRAELLHPNLPDAVAPSSGQDATSSMPTA